jgi:hypothetical protein
MDEFNGALRGLYRAGYWNGPQDGTKTTTFIPEICSATSVVGQAV